MELTNLIEADTSLQSEICENPVMRSDVRIVGYFVKQPSRATLQICDSLAARRALTHGRRLKFL